MTPDLMDWAVPAVVAVVSVAAGWWLNSKTSTSYDEGYQDGHMAGWEDYSHAEWEAAHMDVPGAGIKEPDYSASGDGQDTLLRGGIQRGPRQDTAPAPGTRLATEAEMTRAYDTNPALYWQGIAESIRAEGKPRTVIPWEELPAGERVGLELWDWSRRSEREERAWYEDQDTAVSLWAERLSKADTATMTAILEAG